jgi:hypothetical protein
VNAHIVTITKHRPDIEHLLEDAIGRINTIPPIGFVFLNPMVTVFCEQPTEGFFAEARKHQGHWCKLARRFMGKDMVRSVSAWQTAHQEKAKLEKYMSRSLQFIGVLIVNGKLIPAHEWKNWEPKTSYTSCNAVKDKPTKELKVPTGKMSPEQNGARRL